MPRDLITDYGAAFVRGFPVTVNWLRARGVREPDEIAQWAWTRGWEKLDQFSGENLIGWVASIAINRYRELVRANREQVAIPPHLSDRSRICRNIEDRLDAATLLALCEHPESIVLYVQGFDGAEASEQMGISAKAWRLRVCRSLAKVRRTMQQ